MTTSYTRLELLRSQTARKIAGLSDRGEISLSSVERVLKDHDEAAAELAKEANEPPLASLFWPSPREAETLAKLRR